MFYSEKFHFGQTVDPSEYAGKVKVIDIATNFDTINENIVKLNKLLNYGIMNRAVIKYLPCIETISHQIIIYYAETEDKIAD